MAEEQVSLRLLVDKERNRVVSAEAGKDFIDALLSFLTLPLGTIARIASKDSNLKPLRVGSLSSLYEGVSILETKYFQTEACKEMLLQPRNSMESHQNPKLNIDDSEPLKSFVCENWKYCRYWKTDRLFSTFKNSRCRCGQVMNAEIAVRLGLSLLSENINEGYINELADFTISDDLKVMPSDLLSSIDLMKNLGIEDLASIEEMTLKVNKNEVVDLLKCSLISKMPLTDLFLRKKKVQEDFQPIDFSSFDCEIGKVPTQVEGSKPMKVKVVLKKSKNKVLFAQAEEDFADFLFSFLTFPLGGVLNLLEGNSGSISLDNLFNSLVNLHARKHLRSQTIKNILIKPQIVRQFKLQNQILPMDEANAPNYSYKGRTLTPKSSSMDTSIISGYAKGPSMYMVTDDLVVTPISSVSVASFINKSKVPLDDLEEMVISIGLEEGLSILKASLISPSALTVSLRPFVEREMGMGRFRENIDCFFSLFCEFVLKRKIRVLHSSISSL